MSIPGWHGMTCRLYAKWEENEPVSSLITVIFKIKNISNGVLA
jgi:hypothetical protein